MLAVSEIDELSAYLGGVMDRADHHAHGVEHITLALVGALVWKKDTGTEIKVMQGRTGNTTNVLWCFIKGKRYCLAYSHTAHTIEMRELSTHGKVLYSFTNATPLPALLAFFKTL